MSIALDTNVLIYASDGSSPHHKKAGAFLATLMEGSELVYIFWPVIMGYLRIATHPSIFANPLSPTEAATNISNLLARPNIRTDGEGPAFWATYQATTKYVKPRGNLVPDSHIAALMRHYDVTTIWTNDTDFKKFDGIKAKNPFK